MRPIVIKINDKPARSSANPMSPFEITLNLLNNYNFNNLIVINQFSKLKQNYVEGRKGKWLNAFMSLKQLSEFSGEYAG